MKKDGYTVILAGGGTKGAYQIGAWRALEEEKIPILAAAGASIGALNAALIGQDDFKTAEKIWESININKVVEIPEKLIKNGRIHLSRDVLTDPQILSSAWKNGILLDTTPLKNLIKENLNEEKIRNRGFDLGIVTVNRTDFRPEELFLNDIKEGMLEHFLLASSSLPVFKTTEIKGKKYLDGAFHDNIPFHMMKGRGYKRFIVIDISGLGLNRRPEIAGTETIYIKNSMDTGGILDFNPVQIKENQNLGYLDTMKIFGKNEGLKYFYKPNLHTENKLTTYLYSPEIQGMIREYGVPSKEPILKEILPKEYRYWKNPIPALTECAALALKLPRITLYDYDNLLDLIYSRYMEVEKSRPAVEKPVFQEFFHLIKVKMRELNPENMREKLSPYELIKAGEIITGTAKNNMEKRALIRLFPELPGAFIFFEILKMYNNP
ncbi:MAG: patatin-like phospholipase family protein [Spirochaetales bacterium]|nr:patatin-like phospholipase family protein [Spirochaetales bacterium]